MDRIFESLQERNKVLVFGHRGYSQEYPENTMISFSRCAENPLVDGVELDVHVCRSGEVVVAHDFSMKRTAGLDVEIEDLTWDELCGIDVGSFKGPQFSDARVPLLSSLLETFGDRFYYDIELKVKPGKVNACLSAKVLDIINEHGLQDHVMVSSFNPVALRSFNRMSRRSIPSSDIFSHEASIPRLLRDGQGRIISRSTYRKPEFRQVDESFLARTPWSPVITWTVNTREDARRMLSLNQNGRMNVFGMIGNDPYMISEVVNGCQGRK